MAPDDAKSKKGEACPKCGNCLRVRPDQQGEQLRCPKCNATFTVGQPAAAEKKPPVDSYEPERPVKRATIVHEEPARFQSDDAPPEIMPMAPAVTSHLPQYDTDWATDDVETETPHEPPPAVEPDYLEIARQRGLIRGTDDRPVPKWTFFSRVFTFPWQLGNIARWATMAVALAVAGILLASTAVVSDGTVNMLASPFLTAMAAGMTLVTCSFCSACFVAAVDDTADGQDEVQEITFPPLDQWIFSFFSVLGIWLMSGALGYPLLLAPGVGPVAIPISAIVLFPILYLSAMECDSFILPLSAIVWKTLVRHAGIWLVFYLISTALLAAWYVLALAALEYAPAVLIVVGGPTLAAVILVYARLLGRLAWRISLDVPDVDAPPAATAKKSTRAPRDSKRRKKVGKLKLNLPDDLDRPAGGSQDRAPAPRKRLDFHKPQ